MVAALLAGCAATAPGPEANNDDPMLQATLAEARLAHETGEHDEALELLLEAVEMRPEPALLQRAARLAGALDRWPVALDLTERWLVIDPDSSEALQLRTIAALRGDRETLAGEMLDQVLGGEGRTPDEEDWGRVAALLAAGQGAEQGRRVLDQLLEGREDLPAGFDHYMHSRLNWQLGDEGAARERIRDALQQRPDFEYAMWAARMANSAGEPERALADVRLARAARPDSLVAARVEVDLLRDLGRPSEALAVLERLPNSVETLYTIGMLQFELEQLAHAGATWARLAALAEQQSPAEAAWQVAVLAEVLEFPDQALVWYARVEGDLTNRASLRRAIVLANLERFDEAQAVTKALRVQAGPELVEQSWMVEGQMLLDAGRGEEAIAMFSDALAQDPSSLDLLYARAMAAVELDRLELAEQDLRTIIQNDPDNAVALNALGYTLSDRTDRQNEALRLIETALALDPENAAILDSMGWVLFRLGRADDALPWLERAAAADPHPEIVAHLIEVRHVTGDEVGARVLAARWAEELGGDETFDSTLERLNLAP